MWTNLWIDISWNVKITIQKCKNYISDISKVQGSNNNTNNINNRLLREDEGLPIDNLSYTKEIF